VDCRDETGAFGKIFQPDVENAASRSITVQNRQMEGLN
jgi:hypothetical protein